MGTMAARTGTGARALRDFALAADIQDLPIRLTILGVTYCCSAFFSGSETALFSFQPHELAEMEHGSRAERIVAALRRRSRRTLIAILFGNMLVNVTFFSVSYMLFVGLGDKISATALFFCSVASLVAVLVGGEVVPKNLAVAFHRPIGLAVAWPVLVLRTVLLPIVVPLEKLADLAARLGGHGQPHMQTDEFRVLAQLGAREGIVDSRAARMIAEVVELSDVRVNEMMVPRLQMVCFDLQDPEEELLWLFGDAKLTMIPVYDGDADDMRGVVHIKDVLFRRGEQGLRDLVRPVPFIPETATVDDALQLCRQERRKTAFVVDEYGAVIGMITMEDLLEEIVGDIADEYDAEERPQLETIAGGLVRVDGALSVREWQQALGFELPDLGVDTVGGFVMALLDRVPEAGDKAVYERIELEVESVDGRRAASILVRFRDGAGAPGPEGGGDV